MFSCFRDPFSRSVVRDMLLPVPRASLFTPACAWLYLARYLTYGLAMSKAAAAIREQEVEDFFTQLIMRVAPKSYAQAQGEVVVTRRFLENFSGELSPLCFVLSIRSESSGISAALSKVANMP